MLGSLNLVAQGLRHSGPALYGRAAVRCRAVAVVEGDWVERTQNDATVHRSLIEQQRPSSSVSDATNPAQTSTTCRTPNVLVERAVYGMIVLRHFLWTTHGCTARRSSLVDVNGREHCS